jgi:hypothetical protein
MPGSFRYLAYDFALSPALISFREKAEDGALKGDGYIGRILRHTELAYELSYQFSVFFLILNWH